MFFCLTRLLIWVHALKTSFHFYAVFILTLAHFFCLNMPTGARTCPRWCPLRTSHGIKKESKFRDGRTGEEKCSSVHLSSLLMHAAKRLLGCVSSSVSWRLVLLPVYVLVEPTCIPCCPYLPIHDSVCIFIAMRVFMLTRSAGCSPRWLRRRRCIDGRPATRGIRQRAWAAEPPLRQRRWRRKFHAVNEEP